MSSNLCYLLQAKPSLKQSTGTFSAQVMVMKIFNTQFFCDLSEGLSQRTLPIGKNAIIFLRLSFQYFPSLAEEWNNHVITFFFPRVFPVTNQNSPVLLIDIRPLNACNFAYSHTRKHGEH